jgi:mannose-6-phosphate isomerase-like protein (cupin superfamily)
MSNQKSRWVLGHRVTPVETGADFGLLSIVSPALAEGPPPHFHEDAVELFLILEGTMKVMCDGQWHTLAAGESLVVPRLSVHTFRNPAEIEVKWITTFAPRGFERFFEDFGVPVDGEEGREASLAPDLIGRVVSECASYGMILAKPESATGTVVGG